jgi:hypothetical protein
MFPFLKTPEVAKALGVTIYRINDIIRFGKVDPLPPKDHSGHYAWFPPDVERARQVLCKAPVPEDGPCDQ